MNHITPYNMLGIDSAVAPPKPSINSTPGARDPEAIRARIAAAKKYSASMQPAAAPEDPAARMLQQAAGAAQAQEAELRAALSESGRSSGDTPSSTAAAGAEDAARSRLEAARKYLEQRDRSTEPPEVSLQAQAGFGLTSAEVDAERRLAQGSAERAANFLQSMADTEQVKRLTGLDPDAMSPAEYTERLEGGPSSSCRTGFCALLHCGVFAAALCTSREAIARPRLNLLL